jgi:hypothetical protein
VRRDQDLDFDTLTAVPDTWYVDAGVKYPYGCCKGANGSFRCKIRASSTPLCLRGNGQSNVTEYSDSVGAPSKQCFKTPDLAQLETFR